MITQYPKEVLNVSSCSWMQEDAQCVPEQPRYLEPEMCVYCPKRDVVVLDGVELNIQTFKT